MASHCAPQLTSTALGAGAPVLRLPQVCDAGLDVAHLGRQRLGTRAEGISDDVSSGIHALHYACLGATCRSRQGSIVWNQRKAQLETGSMASHCAPQLTSTALGAGAPVLRLPQVCDAGLDVALLGRQRLGTRAEGISDDVSSGIHALHYACLGATCRSREGSIVWNQRKAQLETGSMASHCAPQLTSTALGAGAPVLRLPQVCDAGLDVALLGRQRLGTRAEGVSDYFSRRILALHHACPGSTCRSRQSSFKLGAKPQLEMEAAENGAGGPASRSPPAHLRRLHCRRPRPAVARSM